jgi:hypothetical protein
MSKQLKQMEQSQQAKGKTLAEWRAQRVHDVDLPSGLTVTVRDVSITDLALTGRVPNTLMSAFVEASEAGDAEKLAGEAIQKNAKDFGMLLDVMAEACMVEPRIADKPGEDCITLAEMPTEDKVFLFNFMNRDATQAVRSFRDGEKEPDRPA